MPISISQLEHQLGITIHGPIPWGQLAKPPGPPPRERGAYIVTVTPDRNVGNAARALSGASVFDLAKIQNWVSYVPKMELHNNRPTPAAIAQYLQQFWHSDESIVYVGKASLRKQRTGIYGRVRSFFGHHLGKKGPHAGGHWLLTLTSEIPRYVWWVETSNDAEAGQVECDILREFSNNCTGSPMLPFANRDGSCVNLPRRKGAALAPQTLRP